MDLTEVDIRRFSPFQNGASYLYDRTVETVGTIYGMHWPQREFETARPARRSALHDRLAALRACFGVAAGWERPNWYAPQGVEPRDEYSFGRQNWFPHTAGEHRAVREAVGLFDQSSFAKFLVQGPDAEAVLQRICANDVGVEPGRVVYTAMLNESGGIEADLTVNRMSEDAYMIVTGGATSTRTRDWVRRNIPADARAVLTDVTSGYGVLGLMGPRSRDLLSYCHKRRRVQRGLPFPVVARDRDRVRAGPGFPHHLCRRAGLGAVRPHRVHAGSSTTG